METSREAFEFVDQELCRLKALYEAMEQHLKDVGNDLFKIHTQQDKYKE